MPESPLARSRAANVKAGPKPLVIPKTINTFGSKSLATPELGPSDVVAKPKVVNSFGSKSFVTAGLKSSATTVTKSLVTSKATSGLSADDNAAELPVDTANNIENETDIKVNQLESNLDPEAHIEALTCLQAFDLESIGSDESALAIDDGAPIKRRQPTLATSLSSGSAARMWAVYFSERLLDWHDECGSTKNCRLHQADILTFEFPVAFLLQVVSKLKSLLATPQTMTSLVVSGKAHPCRGCVAGSH